MLSQARQLFFLTSNISKVGTPSVIQTINLIPDSAASKIESLQNFAGTKINDAFGSELQQQPLQCIKYRFFKCVCPPLPGVTTSNDICSILN